MIRFHKRRRILWLAERTICISGTMLNEVSHESVCVCVTDQFRNLRLGSRDVASQQVGSYNPNYFSVILRSSSVRTLRPLNATGSPVFKLLRSFPPAGPRKPSAIKRAFVIELRLSRCKQHDISERSVKTHKCLPHSGITGLFGGTASW